jgi:predicted O-methyltransferase YrrM
LIVLGAMVLDTLLKVYHKLQIEQVQHYWQTEALFGLYHSLHITQPLPPMRLWAASPDFVTQAVSLIRQHKPQVVFEVGSGVSTLVSSYALRENGSGSLISLEHEAAFAQVTTENVATHGLSDIARVLHAPLKTVDVNGETRTWYDLSNIELPTIDLLVVDGPPEGTGPLARYPALPQLFDYLSPGAFILVDDFMRDDEYTMVNRWLSEYQLTVVRTLANEKGAAILRKAF